MAPQKTPDTAGNEHDEQLIRALLENWIVWRDLGDWNALRSIWHPQGRISLSWFNGSGLDFTMSVVRTFGADWGVD
ncbi:hypothetical protein [Aminobacter sp. MSH1]|uniref:hypothetical protein n=1 Tax=Aminobacter sp. MSH1 TaxID=374606 RepID=UPI000D3C3D50|nr:hypothetical protein [Aminobacter sp. MSH1]